MAVFDYFRVYLYISLLQTAYLALFGVFFFFFSTAAAYICLHSNNFPFPQQPNATLWHIILWMPDMLHFFPNRKSHVLFQSFLGFFLSLDKTVFIISSCTQAADSIWENAWATLFFTTLVLLDPSAQFKHFYVVWSLHFLPKLKQDSVNVRSNLNLIMWFGCSSLSVDSRG